MANVNIFDKASLQGILCRAFQAEFEALVEKELEPAIAEFENKVNLIIQRAKKKSVGEAAKALDAQSGERIGSASASLGTGDGAAKGLFGNGSKVQSKYSDTGGASRFFYVAKASKREKNAGLEGMPKRTPAQKTGRIPGSAGLVGNKTNRGQTANPYANGGGDFQNSHPTVKPIRLMEYLVRLVTPKGGKVLDPFLGSGTTGIAAKRLGFEFIGIEKEAPYLKIARRRIKAEASNA